MCFKMRDYLLFCFFNILFFFIINFVREGRHTFSIYLNAFITDSLLRMLKWFIKLVFIFVEVIIIKGCFNGIHTGPRGFIDRFISLTFGYYGTFLKLIKLIIVILRGRVVIQTVFYQPIVFSLLYGKFRTEFFHRFGGFQGVFF